MHKTTLTLLLVCGLSLQACSKTEHATTAAASQAQTEATPPSGIPLSEVGKMAIESNGKAALQQLLDQESPNTYTVTSVNNVKFINQDQNNKGLYNYTWNIRFKENATQNTLGCDHTDVLWDSDKNEVGAGLKNECMNVLEEAQNAPSNTAQNTSAGTAQTSPIRISLEPDVGQPDYYTNVNIQSTVDQLNFYGLSVNRGNCQVMSDFKPNTYKILHFGSVLKLGARCRRDKIIELTVTTDQGNWTFNP